MDDDIPAALRAPELPLGYAMKTAWRYARSRRLLSRICSEVWLSTPELMQRYAGSSPRLLEPEYVAPQALKKKTLVYFYHGSWAHRREIEWLVPIVKLVQEAIPDAWFEIMGTDRVKHLFRGIPRVRVVHPMPWKDYLAYAGTVQYQIGLAPCFDTDFNRARSHSKMFDITRLGAAGIYSNVIPYAEKVIHCKTGLLCDNDPDKWVAAITLLLKNQDLRISLYSGVMEWCDHNLVRPAS
jgi:glycosyltransferase involved in cell wall biosynthesis